jgi:hypothetical protein
MALAHNRSTLSLIPSLLMLASLASAGSVPISAAKETKAPTALVQPISASGQLLSTDAPRLQANQVLFREMDHGEAHFYPGVLAKGSWGLASFFAAPAAPEADLIVARTTTQGKELVEMILAPGLIAIPGEVDLVEMELPSGRVALQRLRAKPAALQVTSLQDSVRISLDGQSVGFAPVSVPVSLSPTTRVTAIAPFRSQWDSPVELKSGQQVRLKLDLPLLPLEAVEARPDSTVLTATGVPSIEELQARAALIDQRLAAGRSKLPEWDTRSRDALLAFAAEQGGRTYAAFFGMENLTVGSYDSLRQSFPVAVSIASPDFQFTFEGEIPVLRRNLARFQADLQGRVMQDQQLKFSSRKARQSYPKTPGNRRQAGALQVDHRNHVLTVPLQGRMVDKYFDIVRLQLLLGGNAWPIEGQVRLPAWFADAPEWTAAQQVLAAPPQVAPSAWTPLPPELRLGGNDLPGLPGASSKRTSARATPTSFWKTYGRYICYMSGTVLSAYALKEHFNSLDKADNFYAISATDALQAEKSIRDNEARRNTALIGAGAFFATGIAISVFF